MSEVAELKRKTLTKVDASDDEVIFHCSDGTKYRMYHIQDCCESVWLEDVCGDWDDLIGQPLVVAEEATNEESPPGKGYDQSYTWTFYRFATNKGRVSLRWYGASSGYYSESVDFVQLKEGS